MENYRKSETAFNNESYFNCKRSVNYEDQPVEKYKQIPIDIMLTRPTMVSSKATDQIASKKQVEKRKILEK